VRHRTSFSALKACVGHSCTHSRQPLHTL
jgi:hypothetical protein